MTRTYNRDAKGRFTSKGNASSSKTHVKKPSAKFTSHQMRRDNRTIQTSRGQLTPEGKKAWDEAYHRVNGKPHRNAGKGYTPQTKSKSKLRVKWGGVKGKGKK